MTDTHPIDRMVDEMIERIHQTEGIKRMSAWLALRDKFREVMHENHRINTRLMLANEMAKENQILKARIEAMGD